MTTTERKPRNDARREILEAANRKRRELTARPFPAKPYTMRQINQAVRCVRHYGLVSADTLFAAGFREVQP